MSKAIKLLFAAGIFIAASPIALAAERNTGAYIGGAIGKSRISLSCSEGIVSCSRNDTGYKFLGGYQFNPYLAVEGSYIHFGKNRASTAEADGRSKVHAFALSGVGIMPMGQSTALLGKIGVFHSNSKYRAVGSDFRVSEKKGRTGLLIGVGATYALTDNLQARIDYDLLPHATRLLDDRKGKAHLFSVGLNVRF